LFEGRFVVRLALHDAAKHLLRFVMLVLEPVEPREPQSGIRVARIDFQNGLELLDRLLEVLLLHFARAHVAERAHVNSRQQTVGIHVVRIDLQDFLRLERGVADVTRFCVDFGETLLYDRRPRIQFERLLVRFDGLIRLFGAVCDFVLQFVKMARREVVVGIRAGGLIRRFRCGRRLRWGLRWSRRRLAGSGIRWRSQRAEQDGQSACAKNGFHCASQSLIIV